MQTVGLGIRVSERVTDMERQKEHPRKKRRISLAFKVNILIVASIVGIAFGLVLIAFFLNGSQIQSLFMDNLDRGARMCRLAINERRLEWLKENLCSEEFLTLIKQAEERGDPEILKEWMASCQSSYGEDLPEYSFLDEWDTHCAIMQDICKNFGMETLDVQCRYNDGSFTLINSDADVLRLGPVRMPEGDYYPLESESSKRVSIFDSEEQTLYLGELPIEEEQTIDDCDNWFHITMDITAVSDETRWFLLNCLIFLLLFCAVAIPLSMFIIRGIAIKPLRQLQKGSDRFSEGEDGYTLDKVVHMDRKANDEISDLYRGIRAMQTRIVHDIENTTRITAEKERIDTELELAARIQRSALPDRDPDFSGRAEFALCASMDPAKDVGGDFYDFFYQDETHLVMVIADVSGKGIPAALFMMSAKNLIKNRAMTGGTPAEILTAVNLQLARNNTTHMFVTVWLGILDLETGLLTASSAGHEKPFIRRKDEAFEILNDKHGFVLGGMTRSKYTDYELTLQCGDTVFVYTDGVPEAARADGEFYGLERLTEALNDPEAAEPDVILQTVKNNVIMFMNGAEQFDDLTMLCLKYR